MTLTIKTNNQPRQTVPGYVLFANEAIRYRFDYLSDGEFRDESFIKYREWWYALSDFMRVKNDSACGFEGWDGHHSDSCFSGVLVKWADDYGEEVIMGTYYS
jgi:hypothetical protein